jgi:hypothetical protein
VEALGVEEEVIGRLTEESRDGGVGGRDEGSTILGVVGIGSVVIGVVEK